MKKKMSRACSVGCEADAFMNERAELEPQINSSNSDGLPMTASAWLSSSSLLSRKPQSAPRVNAPALFPVFISVAVSPKYRISSAVSENSSRIAKTPPGSGLMGTPSFCP